MMKSFDPLRTLILEDLEQPARQIVSMLASGGFNIQHALIKTPEALVSALDASAWDIVISRHPLSKFRSMEALEILNVREDAPPLVLMVGASSAELAAAALRAGARDCLVVGDGAHLVARVERELRDAEERRERQRLQAQVYVLQRFEAIGRLAGGIAHDFNNVLAAILGSADLELEQLQDKSRSRTRIERIRAQAERGARLTGQLLAYARRQVLEPRNVDLNRLVSETINLREKLPGPEVRTECRLSKGLPPAWADQSQIEQVVMNLCLNARDAMPEGGTLRIETKRVEITAEEELARPYFKAGPYVAIFISDTGTGMEPEVVERIFEPFFTTKGIGKGTGLGLAMVYGIVKQHNGIIRVDSKPQRGTTFGVYLPVGRGRPEMPHKTKALPVRRGSETILVVEHNDGVRDAMKEMLESWGHKVLVASSVGSAAAFFRSHGGAIELAVVDVGVAGIRGPSGLATVSERKFDLPTILTTGYAEDTVTLAAKLGQRVRVLRKPFGFGKLNETIRDLLDGGK